jgi:prepilin-type N-terminal cleavage/methylation domain-containing protein
MINLQLSIFNSRRDGFTFLEVMIALAIVGIAIIAVFNTVNYHADVASEHILTTRMLLAAKEKLAEMEKNPGNQKGSLPETGFTFETTAEHLEDDEEDVMRNIIELKAVIRGHGKEVELSRLVSGNLIKDKGDGQE